MRQQTDLTYQELPPPAELAGYVDACWFYEPDLDESQVDILIPEGVVDLIFNFGDAYFREPVDQKDAGSWIAGDVIAGQRSRLFRVEWPKNTSLFALRIKPEAAYLFVDRPMHEITDATLPMAETAFQALSGAVHAFSFEDRSRIAAHCFEYLGKQAGRLEAPDPRISKMIQALETHEGSVDIQALCDQLGFNRRTIERLFATRVGLSPKFLARAIRVHHFLCMQSENTGTNLSHAAVDAQYYDQSHLIREFKRFTGESPAKFFDSPPEIYTPLLTSLMARRRARKPRP